MAESGARPCASHDCAVVFTEPWGLVGDKEVCSSRCYGAVIAENFFPPPAKDKHQITALGTPVVTAIPYTPMPQDKIAKGLKNPRGSQVIFNRNIYHAHEIIVLVKVAPDLPIRTFGFMQDVYAYTDKRMGLLLRPNMGGVKPTFPDVPRAIAIAARPFRKRHKAGREEAKAEEKADRRAQRLAAIKHAPVAGASYGNPATDNRSKRFFMLESMLLGGTSKEIIERADLMAHKSGIYPRGEILRSIPSNPANVRSQFERIKNIWSKTGIVGKAVEKDGVWRVEVVKK